MNDKDTTSGAEPHKKGGEPIDKWATVALVVLAMACALALELDLVTSDGAREILTALMAVFGLGSTAPAARFLGVLPGVRR